jgi:6-pyruvoyltetrahydropterin/6-carboxytetrahydropterin synthase
MYEVGLCRSFSATHVMPNVAGRESVPHEHDYRVDVVVERSELDDAGMVCDLDDLERCLEAVVGRVEGRALDEVEGLARPEGVTVESFARWTHGELAALLGGDKGELLGVRVWESPVAFGGYRAPSSS